MNMITKEDEKNIAAKAVLLPDQLLTNRAFLLGAAYISHAIINLQIENCHRNDFPDEMLGIFDELTEQLISNFTLDEERKIDPEFIREP